MRVNEFDYRVRQIDDTAGIIAIDLIGGIFMSNLEDFREVIKIQLNHPIKNLILNFGKLDFISSSGIGLLVESSESFRKSGKRLWIVGLEGEIARVFDQFSLEQILLIMPTEKAAVDSITGAGPAF